MAMLPEAAGCVHTDAVPFDCQMLSLDVYVMYGMAWSVCMYVGR